MGIDVELMVKWIYHSRPPSIPYLIDSLVEGATLHNSASNAFADYGGVGIYRAFDKTHGKQFGFRKSYK